MRIKLSSTGIDTENEKCLKLKKVKAASFNTVLASALASGRTRAIIDLSITSITGSRSGSSSTSNRASSYSPSACVAFTSISSISPIFVFSSSSGSKCSSPSPLAPLLLSAVHLSKVSAHMIENRLGEGAAAWVVAAIFAPAMRETHVALVGDISRKDSRLRLRRTLRTDPPGNVSVNSVNVIPQLSPIKKNLNKIFKKI